MWRADSGALKSQSSVHFCLPEPYPHTWRQKFPGPTYPVIWPSLVNSESWLLNIPMEEEKRRACCVNLRANLRLALNCISPPLWLHFQIWDQNRNGRNSTCSFRYKTKQVVTCLTLALERGLGLQTTSYLALPWALRQYERWESFFRRWDLFFSSCHKYLLCVYKSLATVLSTKDAMESKCRYGPFGVLIRFFHVYYLRDVNGHCWWLHVSDKEIEANSQKTWD